MNAPPLIAGLALTAALFTVNGCSESPSHEAESAQSSHTINYQVRGMVAELPDPQNPASDFLVHHEPIPAFKGNYNETTPSGMNAMVMPFPLADGVTLDTTSVGDLITLDFTVNYNHSDGTVDSWHVTNLTPLPADTQLTFGKADDHAAHNH